MKGIISTKDLLSCKSWVEVL